MSKAFTAIVLLLAACATLRADLMPPDAPVAISDLWYEFSFTRVRVAARGCAPADPAGLICAAGPNSQFAPAPAWTFTAPAMGVELQVTDAFLYGDSFDVFDKGVSIGLTPAVGKGGGCGNDAMTCFMDPKSSHEVFMLGAGVHSITIEPTAIADAGAAYFRLFVPEAGSFVITAAGLLVLLAFRRAVAGRR